ncbi:hypothetical protein PybrP1_000097 [[Pythium] brassicae (nom. inval.)]|nr:hypothetical protein PybrP1_000097 [[Pythium] brassicae (nom. inval.)]
MLLKGNSRLYAPPAHEALVSIEMLEICFRSLQQSDPADQALCVPRSRQPARLSSCDLHSRRKISSLRLDKKADTRSMTGDHGDDPHLGVKGKTTRQSGHKRHPLICLMIGAIILLQARGDKPRSIPAAVYVDIKRSPHCVDAARLSDIIMCAAIAVGADPTRYGSRSLRSGGATHMYRAAVEPLTIQLHRRRASNAYKLYTSICEAKLTSLSAKMTCGPRQDTTLQRGA